MAQYNNPSTDPLSCFTEGIGLDLPDSGTAQEAWKEDKLEDITNGIHSNLVDNADDLGDQISELKGFLSETLGDLPFKVAIIIVVLFNFLYTCYDAFVSMH